MRIGSPRFTQPEVLGDTIAAEFADGSEYVHVEGLEFHKMPDAERNDYVLTVAAALGTITLTAEKPGSEIWVLDKHTSPNKNQIPFHTDNPFLAQPERYISFWNVIGSREGGENLILPVGDLLAYMGEGGSRDAKLLGVLAEKPVRFMYGSHEVSSPILDPLAAVARFDMKYVTDEDRSLAKDFQDLVARPDLPVIPIKLAEGDVLFFDNSRTLHARAPYENIERVSLRVRMSV